MSVDDTEESLVPVVYIVDDDPMSRELVRAFLLPQGYRLQVFPSAADFLAAFNPENLAPSCLLLDVCMPAMDGLELQQRLKQSQASLPVIFMSGLGDVPKAVAALKEGACDFLTKPLEIERVVHCVAAAMEVDKANKRRLANSQLVEQRKASLSGRELQVYNLLLQDYSAKEIAVELGVNIKTAFVHRSRVLDKMGVESVIQLDLLVNARSAPSS